MFVPSPQPVLLASFGQVRSIQCSKESDGRAMLNVHMEGAGQVPPPPHLALRPSQEGHHQAVVGGAVLEQDGQR